MSNVNKRYFDSLMQGKEMSLRGLARTMGVSHSQLSLVFSGARKLQISEAAQLASIFGEPLHRIVENAGVAVSSPHGRRVSVIGAMHGDGTVEVHPKGVIERTSAPEYIPEDGIAIQARTSGSALAWLDRFVFFCSAPGGLTAEILGRFAYAKIDGGPGVLATVQRGYEEGSYSLRGPYTADDVRLEFATPVLWTRC